MMVCLLAVIEHGHYTATFLLEQGTPTQSQGYFVTFLTQWETVSAEFVTAERRHSLVGLKETVLELQD
jgi:hypothetical protein